MAKPTIKLILASPMELLRYLNSLLLSAQQSKEDSSIELLPVVTRAKLLTEKTSVIKTKITSRTSQNG